MPISNPYDSIAPPPLGRIESCTNCARPLPLLLPLPNKPSAAWLCCHCSAEYEALLDADAPFERVANVRLIRAPTINLELPTLRSAPASFFREGSEMMLRRGPERRRSLRYPALVPYAAVPVDAAIVPTEEPFVGFTRNMSTAGVALLANRPVGQGLLVVELWNVRRQRLRLLMKVVDCRRFKGMHEIAGPLLMRLDT